MRLALAILLLASQATGAETLVEQGFEHFYNLEYGAALAAFESAIQQDPENPDLHNHVAQAVLYDELFRLGALESELVTGSNPFVRRRLEPTQAGERRFHAAIEGVMALAGERLERNRDDAAAHFALGVAHGLRANFRFLVRKSWMDSLRDATEARKQHEKVLELEPDNVDAEFVRGIHEYVVGSLPWLYRVLGFVVGFRGDKREGIETLERVARDGEKNRDDAKLLLCAIYRREERPADAVPHLSGLIGEYPRNYILRLELVQMYSDLGEKQKGLDVVREMLDLHRMRAPGYGQLPLEKILFARGTLLFWYRDLELALEDFRRVTAGAEKLDLNTEALAWLRLGQSYDLLGQRQDAVRAYQMLLEVAPESDRAPEAKRYLRRGYRRE